MWSPSDDYTLTKVPVEVSVFMYRTRVIPRQVWEGLTGVLRQTWDAGREGPTSQCGLDLSYIVRSFLSHPPSFR